MNLIDSSRFKEAQNLLLKELNNFKNEPNFFYTLGFLFNCLNDLENAELNYKTAIILDDQYVDPKFNLALIYYRKNQLGDAERIFKSIINVNPKEFNSFYNLGVINFQKRDLSSAISYFKKVISLKEDYSPAYHQLAACYEAQGEFNLAIEYYKKAIRFDKQGLALSYNNLGNVYLSLRDHQEAYYSFQKALNLKGNKSSVYFNLGIASYELNNISEALNYFEKSIELDNDKNIKYISVLLACSHFLDKDISYYKKFSTKYRESIKRFDLNLIKNFSYSKDSIIKVGILSGNLKKRPTGYFLLDLLEKIKKKNTLELHAFSNSSTKEDEYTKKLKNNFNYWHDVSLLNDLDLINLIRQQKINILIDMQGHTYDNRIQIFANKPAPVQISWAEYLASTGIPEIDYLVGDNFVTPSNHQDIYVEKIWNMPNIWCPLSTSDIDHIKPAESPVNKNGFVTFGCFNNIKKINDKLIQSWAKILTSVDNSKLYIKSDQFNKKEIQESFIKKFILLGVKINQLIFEKNSERQDLLKSYNKVDIALDTYPYSGGTTNLELSFMCVPLITVLGKVFISRCGASVNQNLSMKNLIAKDLNEYTEIAINLARDINKLNSIRNELIKNSRNSALFDSDRFSDDFIFAIKEMWTIFLKQNKQF